MAKEKVEKQELVDIIADLNKKYGQNTVVTLNDKRSEGYSVIPSGSISVDYSVLGIGGFAKGKLYTRHCTNSECGFDNGGLIVGDKSPVSEKRLEIPPDPCIRCGSFAEWLLVGEM